MYEFMSASGNVVTLDLEKVYWAKTNYPENTFTVHFGKFSEDLIVGAVDFPTSQALVDDISKKKEAYHASKENNFKIEEVVEK
jgi:hypothetical protein